MPCSRPASGVFFSIHLSHTRSICTTKTIINVLILGRSYNYKHKWFIVLLPSVGEWIPGSKSVSGAFSGIDLSLFCSILDIRPASSLRHIDWYQFYMCRSYWFCIYKYKLVCSIPDIRPASGILTGINLISAGCTNSAFININWSV